MPYIFLDESGNLTKAHDTYFIVGSFSVGNPKRVTNAFRRWQQLKFPKKLKYQSEIKFNNANLSDTLRRKTLRYLVQQDIQIYYTYLSTNNIPKDYVHKNRVSEAGLLYLEIVGATLELYLPLATTEFRVFRDHRTTKGMTSSAFNNNLKTRLLPKLPAKTLLQVESVDSTTSALIQAVDWICGALARYHQGKPNGEEFYHILRPSIVEQKELFSKSPNK